MKLMATKELQSELLSLMSKLHAFLVENNISYYLIAGSALGAIRHGGFIPWDDDIDIGMFREDYEKFLEISDNFDYGYDVKHYKNSKYCDYTLCRIYINNTLIDNPKLTQTKLDKRVYLDIFPLDNVPESEEECKLFEKKIKQKKALIQYCDVREYNRGRVRSFAKKIISIILSPLRDGMLKRCDKLMRKYENIQTSYVCSLCSQYSMKKQKMLKEYYGTPTLHRFDEYEFFIPEMYNDYLTKLYGEDYMEIPPENKRRKGYDIYRTGDE